MAAEDNLSPMFHGTNANLKPGDIIKPSYNGFKRETRAWATTSLGEAHSYAHARSQSRGAMIGSIYQVEPLENDETLRKEKPVWGDQRTKPVRSSEKGFRVVKHERWV